MLAVFALTFAVTLCLGALAPGSARALEGADAWQLITMTVFDLESGKEPTLVIRAVAKDGTQPPLAGAVAIPKGSELIWAGNILGGDPADDPMVPVEIVEMDDYDLVTFTIEESPVMQIELVVPEGILTPGPNAVDVSFAYTAAGDVDIVRLGSVVLPSQRIINDDPEATPELLEGLGVLYSVETSPVAEGQTMTFTGQVVLGEDPEIDALEASAAAAATPTPEATTPVEPIPAPVEPVSGPTDWTWIIIGALVVLIGVVIYVIYRQIRTESDTDAVDEVDERYGE
jgi:hypothetical protein